MQYGKADYIKHLTDQFLKRNATLTDEQKQRVQELNEQSIFREYLSIHDFEVRA